MSTAMYKSDDIKEHTHTSTDRSIVINVFVPPLQVVPATHNSQRKIKRNLKIRYK